MDIIQMDLGQFVPSSQRFWLRACLILLKWCKTFAQLGPAREQRYKGHRARGSECGRAATSAYRTPAGSHAAYT